MSSLLPPAAVPPETPFRRLHPLTPLLRGWAFLAAIGLVGAQQSAQDLSVSGLAWVAAVLVPVAAVYGTASWWFMRYRISDGDLAVESGLVIRQSRRIRLDRLQAVEVNRPLLARLLGLAELRLEVVGGSSAEAPLAYLSEAEAHRLRAELLARAAGLAADEPEAPERTIAEVSAPRLVGAVLLRPYFVYGILALSAVIGFSLFEGAVVVGVAPFVLGLVAPFYAGFVRQFGFTVAESPDGLRLRSGLLETKAQTVPPGRVQAVRIVRPWSWRLFTDWVRLEVNIAGYSGGKESRAVLLPVADPHQARAVLELVLPGFDLEEVPLSAAPVRARWLRPVGWRRLRIGSDGHAFVTASGVWQEEWVIVPHGKAQSVRLIQGPLQRRLHLATIHLDVTPGPAVAVARHRDLAEAGSLLREAVDRSRAGRENALPDRWMTR